MIAIQALDRVDQGGSGIPFFSCRNGAIVAHVTRNLKELREPVLLLIYGIFNQMSVQSVR